MLNWLARVAACQNSKLNFKWPEKSVNKLIPGTKLFGNFDYLIATASDNIFRLQWIGQLKISQSTEDFVRFDNKCFVNTCRPNPPC